MADLKALFPKEALVEIQPYEGEKYNVTVDIDSFEESGFERDVEYRRFFNDASVAIEKPQGEGEITMNAKITRQLWDYLLWGSDTGSLTDITSGADQPKCRIVFLVSKDPNARDQTSEASMEIQQGYDTYRKAYADCRMTSFNPSLETDGLLEGEATFSLSATDDAGRGNVRRQMGSDGFNAFADYTGSVKW